MLTYKQLLARLPYKKDFKKRVGRVDAKITKAEIVKRGARKGVKFSAVGKAHTDKVWYACEVEMYPEEIGVNKDKEMEVYEDLNQNTHCWVHCDCPHFVFSGAEYVLANNYGSSEIRNGNGKPPVVTNPNDIPYVCKHLHKLLPLALDALKKISKP